MALLGLNTFLVGALEHELFDFPYMGMSSSQVTNSIIFQRGRLNHQPAFKRQKKGFPLKIPVFQGLVQARFPLRNRG